MGPYIAKPRILNHDEEVQRIAELLRDNSLLTSSLYGYLHNGGFVRTAPRTYTHIRCSTCGYTTDGPIVNMANGGPPEVLEEHRIQWRTHIAEHAIADGVDI